MKRSTIGIALTLLLLGACSKSASTDSEETSSPEASAPTFKLVAFDKLNQFNGKAPWDLVKDETVGKAIRAIVPKAQFKCMDDIFNYMPDLTAGNNGLLAASLNGSHADNFMEGFISVSPTGAVNIVLQCDLEQKESHKKYQFFTNEGVGAATPKEVLDWMYMVGSDGDTIAKSDGQRAADIPYNTFLDGMQEGVAAAEPTQVKTASPKSSAAPAPARPVSLPAGKRLLPAGAVICLNLQSFYKVNAIETTGNAYASLPDDCMNQKRKGLVEVVQSIGDPVLGDMALITSNGSNRAYARLSDLQ